MCVSMAVDSRRTSAARNVSSGSSARTSAPFSCTVRAAAPAFSKHSITWGGYIGQGNSQSRPPPDHQTTERGVKM